MGRIPSEEFRALQEVLERIAAEVGHTAPQREGSEAPRRMAVENVVLVYELDDATRTLTLLELIRPSESR